MFELMKLNYELDALEPYISKKTMEFHYLKHHQNYVNRLNELIQDTPFENMSLEEIIVQSYNDNKNIEIYNNAGQVWNHNFYWNSLNPKNRGISDNLQNKIDESFGSFSNFEFLLKKRAVGQFGSGWTWIVERENKYWDIYSTANADSPLIFGGKPLLVIDVWEHGYYLDYQNRRVDYVEKIINLLNWDKIEID